jgi:outer membrane protein insertion porin family
VFRTSTLIRQPHKGCLRLAQLFAGILFVSFQAQGIAEDAPDTPARSAPPAGQVAPSPPAPASAGPTIPVAQDGASKTEPVLKIRSYSVEGSSDPPGRVEALLATMAAPGTPFVLSGDADRTGIPIGTVARMKQVLGAVGYLAEVTSVPDGDGVRLHLRLRPFDRVRHIFVSGNQPLPVFRGVRQDDIVGKLSFRPGQKLPPAGSERDAFLASQADRVREFLQSQGYWESSVRFELREDRKVSTEINLMIRTSLGPPYPLGPIHVSGATAIPAEEIADEFHHKDWHWLWLAPQPFRLVVLREDEHALVERYRGSGFPGVRVRDDFDPQTSVDRKNKQVRLNLEVRERRHIEVTFEGNRSRSSGSLLDALTLLTHGAYDDVEASESAAALESTYHEHGHMLVRVVWRRERISEDSDRLVFVIDEGPELKVREVSFVGNHAIAADTLAERVRTKPYPTLGFLGLGEGGYASLRQLELDVQSLVDYYASVGYPDTKVRAEIAPRPGLWRPLSPTPEADDPVWIHAEGLRVRFIIEESQPLLVGSMSFESMVPGEILPHEDGFFLRSLRTVAGAPYQPAFVRRDEAHLKRALGDDGYRYAGVEARLVRNGNLMDITWQVRLGPQVRVGPIFIRGNFLTTDDTILTWAELRTGDVLTTRALERAQRNLALIQLFNNPNPLTFPQAAPDQAVLPMLVEVEERHDHYGVFRVGVGGSTDQATPGSSIPVGVYGALGYEHRNLFGHGWIFTTEGRVGQSLTSATASFLDPRLFGSLFRLGIDASYLQQATLRLGDIHSGSGSIGVARELYSGVDGNISYNLRNTSRTELLDRSAESGPFLDQTTVRLSTLVGSLSTGVEWHRLDHVLVPTQGFKVAAGLEVALPALSFGAGHDTFIKVYARGLSVIPLLRWLSLRYSIRYDQGLPLGGSAVLPKVERYYAGGDTTIRGYQLDWALTETVRSPGALGVTYVQYRPIGGNLRILQNIDLQFPLSPPLYGSVFLDSGMVGYFLGNIGANDFRHGVGFSPLIIKLPVGDVSLSFAVPLNRHPGDDTWRTHFNVGLMF